MLSIRSNQNHKLYSERFQERSQDSRTVWLQVINDPSFAFINPVAVSEIYACGSFAICFGSKKQESSGWQSSKVEIVHKTFIYFSEKCV